MTFAGFGCCEYTGGFGDDVYSGLAPWDKFGFFFLVNCDFFTVDYK